MGAAMNRWLYRALIVAILLWCALTLRLEVVRFHAQQSQQSGPDGGALPNPNPEPLGGLGGLGGSQP